jgi:probable FeS assembly SUF system protein SufT
MIMADNETIILTRDVEVVTIPDGNLGQLTAGEYVVLHQALGNNFTVITSYGHMVRIAGKDADALGKQSAEIAAPVNENNAQAIEQNCWAVMKTVYDPEIPVNIVDLGLVYSCEVILSGSDHYHVHVKMTLTAPGCGMGPVIQSDVERGIRALPNVERTEVEIVLDPPWSREMMSEAAQLQLGLF